MERENQTMSSGFQLVGFSDIPWLNGIFFLLFLTMYLVTLLGNLLLIILRRIDPRLHTPMYFFLGHLSFIDICYTTTFVPKMLTNFLVEDKSISFLGCASQMHCYLSLGTTELLLLTIMAYDRYVAIYHPLRYSVLMSEKVCTLLAAGCWICGFVNALLHTVLTFLSPFCRSRKLNHFFCEIQLLLRLSCANTKIHENVIYASVSSIVLCSFLLTLFSYFRIISTIMKTKSSEGRSKAFSTCSSHLVVMVINYATLISVYMRPISSYTPERDRVVSVIYTVVIPMCNPIIYSIRNKEVKEAMGKLSGKTCCTVKM